MPTCGHSLYSAVQPILSYACVKSIKAAWRRGEPEGRWRLACLIKRCTWDEERLVLQWE